MAKDTTKTPTVDASNMEDLGYTYDNCDGPDCPDPVPGNSQDQKVHYPSVRIEGLPGLEKVGIDDLVEVHFMARVRGIDSHSYGENSNAKTHLDLDLQKGAGVIVGNAKSDSQNTDNNQATTNDVAAMKATKNSDYMAKLANSES